MGKFGPLSPDLSAGSHRNLSPHVLELPLTYTLATWQHQDVSQPHQASVQACRVKKSA